jgi:membrane protease YdiL (CAAX protease family)
LSGLVSGVVKLILLSIPTVIYLLVRRRRTDRGRRSMGLTWGATNDYLWAIGAVVVLGGLLLAATKLIPADVLATAGTTNRITTLVAALAVIVSAAGEEMLFRGFLQGVVSNRFGKTAGIWVQAGLFLLPHLALLLLVSPLVWPILPAQFLTGLALGWLRSRHDSIAPTIAVHAVANVIAGLIV